MIAEAAAICLVLLVARPSSSQEWWKPYSPPCTERENVFAFTQKPKVKRVGKDKYEITFAVKGYCDVTVGIVDAKGKVVRHLGSGVLGRNAPPPFEKDSLKQTIYWNGKDDLQAYVRDPERLRVRVMLGLRPAFERLLGDAGPYNLFGYVWGIAIDQDAAYVFAKGSGNGQLHLRKFDRDGKYLGQIFPPPATMPHEKLQGMGYVEYEPGRFALQGRDLYESVANRGYWFPRGVSGGRGSALNNQPVIIGDRIWFTNPGAIRGSPKSLLHYIHKDGSTDIQGMKGLLMLGVGRGRHSFPHQSARLAASPDGKTIYMSDTAATDPRVAFYVIWQRKTSGADKATPFLGALRSPGSGNKSFAHTAGIDCDPKGRLYVCDVTNNRVQIYDADAKHLKTIGIQRPFLIRVHRRTGAIYVMHMGRVGGKTQAFLTKLAAFEDSKVIYRKGMEAYSCFALDHWSPRPRFWLGGGRVSEGGNWEVRGGGSSVRVFEEQGADVKLLLDFDSIARKAAGRNYMGRWGGGKQGGSGIGGKVVCDPTRGQAYYERAVFDLNTGDLVGAFAINASTFDDFAFDKRGRMHVHFNPGFFMPGVGRVDPAQARKEKNRQGKEVLFYPEMPYDYGIEKTGRHRRSWLGVLPVRDQPGAKYFQDGIGVNMTGDVAVESNIYYVPKMEDTGFQMVVSGMDQKGRREEPQTGDYSYAKFMSAIREKQKRGEVVYFVRRRPGVPLCGATVWTFDRTGEVRGRPAAVVGSLINGVRIDEDRELYFVNNRSRIAGNRPFLSDRTGRFGEKGIQHLMSGTLMRTAPEQARILLARSAVPMADLPKGPAELMTMGFHNVYGKDSRAWAKGARWLYAGATPIVQDAACSCPTQRFHLDWYKRSYVPEAYRHSIGVVDANGNLIMHIGRYGNYDSGHGAKSRVPVGGDNIAMIQPRFVSGTDDRLVFTDWCERIVVLKLNCHAEETVGIRVK